MAITPEGTRSLKPYWRSGFYHIATTAKVPLACVYFDFSKRVVSLVDYLDLSGDRDIDMASIQTVYAGVQGCRPAYAGPIALRPEEEKSQ